ncbi:eukaryotic mitochondrial regulator protein-domain-containing protein [Talaromyces proteolyticus]|uniref:Eukaryotic mitochondrial regulator protein-domain-containing protein n=1 Tax=Talaromyces proteolyticus TaxID=1131652 RepID=A0AAD4Q3I0_9EURO|nr:eukaryotic mitochondrial regulator protein-domain-containing protein [Talaromyces proteolyticus]KAH8701798.1 eukaryotic mitochondrial regulator protein-domain-containing protein [Talaromyces proteolyticus]
MPRIQGSVSNSLASCIPSSSSTSTPSAIFTLHNVFQREQIGNRLKCPSRRPFSTSRAAQTRHRAAMFTWLGSEGATYKHHVPGRTNYITEVWKRKNDKRLGKARDESEGDDSKSRPFPLNENFVSSPILSEELRNEIHRRVVKQKKGVRAVSVELQVEMRRIAAAVRLVELEKRMTKEGKFMAIPYARAIHEMVPVTPLAEEGGQPAHEHINELPVHRLTDPQIFYPVSESRQFTRVDAGRVFSAAPALESREEKTVTVESLIIPQAKRIERVGKGADEHDILLPADARIPHPHMIGLERDIISHPTETRYRMKRYNERLKDSEEFEKERKTAAKERAEKRLTRVSPEGSRFEFRFNDVVVSKETTGLDGRGHAAPGRRYGVPTYDRKKGQVKIPTKVEV